MVLMRTLLSAPILTLPPTRQLLSHWRSSTLGCYCPVRPNCWVSALNSRFHSLADGASALRTKSRFDSAQVFTNWRFEKGLKRFQRKRGVWKDVAQIRVQCLSTLASDKELSISVPVTLEDNTTVDVSAQAAVEQLQIDGPLALKLVVENLEDLENTDTVELSLLLCNDVFIQDLNLKWLGNDNPMDVLSFPQDQAPGLTPYLLLGDVIISLDTAARQAEERGHTLLDELRIFLVHGMLHVLDYDHELGPDSSQEMEEKEAQILSKLGWKGRGLINAAFGSSFEEDEATKNSAGISLDEPAKKRAPKPAFKILFYDLDGTLVNSKLIATEATGDALKAAMTKGVQVITATGKCQYGAMSVLQPLGLTGEGGVISSTSPGIFTQGLQV